MDELNINGDFGSYTIILKELKKGFALINVLNYSNLEGLLNEASRFLAQYGEISIYFTTEKKEDYEVFLEKNEYVFPFVRFKSDKNYKLIPLSLENRSGFLKMINEIYNEGSLFVSWDENDVLTKIRNDETIGYLSYKKEIIGIYYYRGNEILNYGILRKHQGFDYGINGLKKLISRIGEKVIVNIMEDNQKAILMVLELGFYKNGNKKYWYKLK